MRADDRHLFECGSKVFLKNLYSTAVPSGINSNRLYESDVLEVYEPDLFKLSLPKEPTGEVATLSLDTVYEVRIQSEEDNYRGKGKIVERFRDEDGNVCVFRMIESLSLEEKKKFLSFQTSISAEYMTEESTVKEKAFVKEISMDKITLKGTQYIPENTTVIVIAHIEETKNIKLKCVVTEAVRLRGGASESRMSIVAADVRDQRDLAAWILRQTAMEV